MGENEEVPGDFSKKWRKKRNLWGYFNRGIKRHSKIRGSHRRRGGGGGYYERKKYLRRKYGKRDFITKDNERGLKMVTI